MKPTVIVVDDVPVIREELCFLIEKDYEIVAKTDSAPSALQLIDRFEPELLVLDIVLGGHDSPSGIDLMKELSKRHHRPSVVAVTGLTDPRWVEDCLAAGASDVVQKPVEGKRLLAALQSAYQRRTPK